ncbi:MAG TPA: HD domain-containing phosphohydrolase [Geobacteraceae bacterium]
MRVDMRQMVLVIASAVDLVGVDDVLHGRRVGVMAVQCAKSLGWDQATQNLLFDAGLLHDCGVSSTRVYRNLMDDPDWQGANIHCGKGNELLRGFNPLAHLAQIVLYHHTHWDRLVELSITPTVALYANLIYLVNWVDSSAIAHYADRSLLLHTEELRGLIEQRRGTFFAPELVDAFLDASRTEAFWLLLDPDFIHQYVNEIGQFPQKRSITLAELKQFALTIAAIVDAKSHFTAGHSRGVGRLARYIAKKAGIAGARLDFIEVAGMLHDIGKLQTPDEVLESTAKLSPAERALMKRHSFATYQILKRIVGFEKLARWASQHHESPAGDGYPFHMFNGEIPLESQIIRVADIFQALAQDRPYRAALPAAEIMAILRELEAANEVEPKLVGIVARHLDECHAAAVGPTT